MHATRGSHITALTDDQTALRSLMIKTVLMMCPQARTLSVSTTIGTVLLTGLVMMLSSASGQCFAHACARFATMPTHQQKPLRYA